MESYAKLQEGMLAGRILPKFLVAVPNLSGMADRIIGLTTVAMLAIANDRAFQIGNRIPLPLFDIAFYGPNIKWNRPTDPEWLIEPLKYRALIRNYNDSILQSGMFYGVNTIEDLPLQDRLLREKLDTIAQANSTFVLMSNNRGKTIRMFENHNYRLRLSRYGLNPDNAFGCILNFLMAPKPQIFAPFYPQLMTMSNMSILRIGIQIRAGDQLLMSNGNHTVNIHDYMTFFRCAQQIESFAQHPGQQSIWYLMTDSLALRQEAKKKFGNKLLVAMNATVEHTSKEDNVCKENCTVSDRGFQDAAAEWWMFGWSDYFVISKYSGYGRSAAMRSMKRTAIYTVTHGRQKINCGQNAATNLRTLAEDWSGI
jgi:hypothetical protein